MSRNLSAPADRRESALKHQTRCIRINPDQSGACSRALVRSCIALTKVFFFSLNQPTPKSPRHLGYVLASVEGRVAVEYFDSGAEAQGKRYAFKVSHASQPASQSQSL